ncbi:MAG: hypothetical protein ACREBU_25680 [Nitrososphaera sp.]
MEHGRVILSYRYRRNEEDWESLDYSVALETTPCTYGGYRYWLRCPAAGCGRRVVILYLGGCYFACRHCYWLAYESQHESAAGRALLKAQRLRIRLGGSASLAESFPEKPKGMHWRTYARLRAQAEEVEMQSWEMLAGNLLRWWRAG